MKDSQWVVPGIEVCAGSEMVGGGAPVIIGRRRRKHNNYKTVTVAFVHESSTTYNAMK